MRRWILMAMCSAALSTGAQETRVLVLVDDHYGANGWLGQPQRPSILETFAGFGWTVDLASPRGEVRPCAFAAKEGLGTLATRRVGEVKEVDAYDGVIILPGASQQGLAKDPQTRAILREADAKGLVLAAFCRGVRVLAAADVLAGHRVSGPVEDRPALEAAGARFLDFTDAKGKSDAPPPVVDGNLVTGVRGSYYRGRLCDAIRIAVENARGTRWPFGPLPEYAREPARHPLFAFPLELGGMRQALLLARSLRRCGGALAHAPLVAVLSAEVSLGEGDLRDLMTLEVEPVTYTPDPRLAEVILGNKADAARAAEVHAAERGADVLVWMDLDSVVVREPSEFLLPAGSLIAFRPVHHRLIGSKAAEPPDAFWSAVLSVSGVDSRQAFPVISTIDREVIRFYPNAGCLAVRPQAGLLAAWQASLVRAARDLLLKDLAQKDARRNLFLHQAVLAATILAKVPRAGIRELSFAYNYPVHLHRGAPEDLRPGKLEDLVTVRYEEPGTLETGGLPMAEATRRALFGEGSATD